MDIVIFVRIGQIRGHLWILELEKLGEIYGYWNYHRNLGGIYGYWYVMDMVQVFSCQYESWLIFYCCSWLIFCIFLFEFGKNYNYMESMDALQVILSLQLGLGGLSAYASHNRWEIFQRIIRRSFLYLQILSQPCPRLVPDNVWSSCLGFALYCTGFHTAGHGRCHNLDHKVIVF